MTAQPYPNSYAGELIAHAKHLGGLTQPADHRRSVSAYYYATFHALGCAIAEYFLPPFKAAPRVLLTTARSNRLAKSSPVRTRRSIVTEPIRFAPQ